MGKRTIYPRGFESPSTTSKSETLSTFPQRHDGDAEVNRVYDLYMSEEAGTESWEFKASVMTLAKRLLGENLNQFIGVNATSRFLHSNARKFIVDTINYLQTGNRTISPRNWIDLIDDTPEELPRVLTEPKIELLPIADTHDLRVYYLQAWLNKPNGFEDLLISLYILFGESLISKKRRLGQGHVSPKNPNLLRLHHALTGNR